MEDPYDGVELLGDDLYGPEDSDSESTEGESAGGSATDGSASPAAAKKARGKRLAPEIRAPVLAEHIEHMLGAREIAAKYKNLGASENAAKSVARRSQISGPGKKRCRPASAATPAAVAAASEVLVRNSSASVRNIGKSVGLSRAATRRALKNHLKKKARRL